MSSARFCILAAAALLSLSSAHAQFQSSGVVTLITGTTNDVIAATATNSYTLPLDVSRSSAIALWIQYKGHYEYEDPESVTVVLKRSVDGTTFEAAETYRVALGSVSNTVVNLLTNLSIGSERFLRLTAIENATTNVITNLVVSFSFKR